MPTEIGRNAMHTVKGRNTMPILLIQFLLNEQQYNWSVFGRNEVRTIMKRNTKLTLAGGKQFLLHLTL